MTQQFPKVIQLNVLADILLTMTASSSNIYISWLNILN